MKVLAATVKEVLEGDPIQCRVFMLRDDLAPGQILELHKYSGSSPQHIAGIFRIEQIAKEILFLHRVEGDPISPVDALYLCAPDVPKPEPIRPVLVDAHIFLGKNWRLASAKKWKPRKIERPSSEPLGTISINGNCDVFRWEDGFAAVPQGI